MSGATRMSASPATSEPMLLMPRALVADGAVQGQGPVDEAAPDLAPPSHLRDDGGVDRAGHLLVVDLLDRREEGDLGEDQAEGAGGPDRVGDDGELGAQIGRDIDRGVGDEEELVVGGDFQDGHVARQGCPSLCPAPY